MWVSSEICTFTLLNNEYADEGKNKGIGRSYAGNIFGGWLGWKDYSTSKNRKGERTSQKRRFPDWRRNGWRNTKLELKIVYSKVANLDLKEIYSFITQDSIKYARREVELIQTAIKKLKKEPFIGKQFEESDDEFTRELIYETIG